MRFAISTSQQRTTWPWLLEVWQRADEFEVFEAGWTFDHFYPLFGDSTEDCLEGWTTLTALIHETSRLRGGVLVSGMVYRHPGLLAHIATTLDITSGGRIELGVGAGWNEEECDAYGIELGSLRERFDRFEEGMEVIHRLLTRELTDYDGKYFHLAGAMNNPKPVQSPLPICIGGVGQKRTMPMVARYAHHWNYAGTDPAQMQMLRGVIEQRCAEIDRDPAEIRTSWLARWTTPEALVEEVAAYAAAGADQCLISLPKSMAPADVAVVARTAEQLR